MSQYVDGSGLREGEAPAEPMLDGGSGSAGASPFLSRQSVGLRWLFVMAFVLAWGGALFGCTRLSTADVAWTHALCGPWGCGPPAQAVLGVHLIWLLLIGGVGVAAGGMISGAAVCRWGAGLLAVATVALLIIVADDLYTWLPQAGSTSRRYLPQRALYATAIAVDVPAIQGLFVGSALWLFGRRRHHASERDRDVPA